MCHQPDDQPTPNEQTIMDLEAIIAEVHGWAVCYAIATPQDMAQDFPRIIEITDPLYPEMVDPEVVDPTPRYLYHSSGVNACHQKAYLVATDRDFKSRAVILSKDFTHLDGTPCKPQDEIRCGSCGKPVIFPSITDIRN